MNVVLGVFMLGLYVFARPNPPLVAITAVFLAVQGGYTVWCMYSARLAMELPTRLLIVGETLALLIGIGGPTGATLQTALIAVDAEYGPIALAGLITAQAAVTLNLYAIRRDLVAD